MTPNETLKDLIPDRAMDTYVEAFEHSSAILARVQQVADEFLLEQGIAAQDVCIAVVGSFGRREAMKASDVDVLPITTDNGVLDDAQDGALRARLRSRRYSDSSKQCAPFPERPSCCGMF